MSKDAALVRIGEPERFEIDSYDKARDRRKKILGIKKLGGRPVSKCKVVRRGGLRYTSHFEVIAYGPARAQEG